MLSDTWRNSRDNKNDARFAPQLVLGVSQGLEAKVELLAARKQRPAIDESP